MGGAAGSATEEAVGGSDTTDAGAARGTGGREVAADAERARRWWWPRPRVDWPPLAERLCPPMPVDRFWWMGWGGPLLVAIAAGVMRFWKLGWPHAVVFDETYYAKDAWSLLHFGVEHNWPDSANTDILAGGQGGVLDSGSFIVHPPIGKYMIAVGEWLFGLNPFGWRFMTALVGTLAVLMVCRIGRRLFRSTLLGCTAGVLMAFDGLAFVMSRTALLDGILMFWILAAFGCLLVDRDHMRARLLRAHESGALGLDPTSRGPKLGLRPWRLAAGVCLGLAASTKWTGFVVAAFFIIMSLLWDRGAHKAVGLRYPSLATLRRRSLWTAVVAAVTVPVLYVVTWIGWFLHRGPGSGYDRDWWWRQNHRVPSGWWEHIWSAWCSWWHYQWEIWNFNTNLLTTKSPHPYMSNPWSWLVLGRPVSFYYCQEGVEGQNCPGNTSGNVREILALGNPVLWWGATVALLFLLYLWLGRRDWRGGAILCGLLASYLPWFNWQDRTIFSFYTITFVPFLALALTMAIGKMIGQPTDPRRRRVLGTAAGGGIVVLAILCFMYFYPIYDAHSIPIGAWQDRMWLDSWI